MNNKNEIYELIENINQMDIRLKESIDRNPSYQRLLKDQLDTCLNKYSELEHLLNEALEFKQQTKTLKSKAERDSKTLNESLHITKNGQELLVLIEDVSNYCSSYTRLLNTEDVEEKAIIIGSLKKKMNNNSSLKEVVLVKEMESKTDQIKSIIEKEAFELLEKSIEEKNKVSVFKALIVGQNLNVLDRKLKEFEEKLSKEIEENCVKLGSKSLKSTLLRNISNLVFCISQNIIKFEFVETMCKKLNNEITKNLEMSLIFGSKCAELLKVKLDSIKENDKELAINYIGIIDIVCESFENKDQKYTNSYTDIFVKCFDEYSLMFFENMQNRLIRPIEMAMPKNAKMFPTKNDIHYIVKNTFLELKTNSRSEKILQEIRNKAISCFQLFLSNIESTIQFNSNALYIPTANLIKLNKNIKLNETQNRNSEVCKTLDIFIIECKKEANKNRFDLQDFSMIIENAEKLYLNVITPLVHKITSEIENCICKINISNEKEELIISNLKSVANELELKSSYIIELLSKYRFKQFDHLVSDQINSKISILIQTYLLLTNSFLHKENIKMELATQTVQAEFIFGQILDMFNIKSNTQKIQLGLFKRFLFTDHSTILNDTQLTKNIDPVIAAVQILLTITQKNNTMKIFEFDTKTLIAKSRNGILKLDIRKYELEGNIKNKDWIPFLESLLKRF